MPKQAFALEPGGEKRLVVSWGTFWKDTQLSLDGKPVGTIPGQKELVSGRSFRLPDGSELTIQLVRGLLGAELRLARNGRPLPGSASDPLNRLRNAYAVVYFIAGLNLILGFLAVVLQIDFFQQLVDGQFALVYGSVFLVLGYTAQRRSSLALILAAVLFGLDGLLGLIGSIVAGYPPSIAGLLLRVLLIVPILQGVGAVRQLKANEAVLRS